jgi:predicted transposase YbfD/YdcC
MRRVDGDHGRIETRTYTALELKLKERHDWLGLQGVVMVESTHEIGDKIEQETRFYITSLVRLANQLGPVSHWAVENSLHWVMDMIFRDVECRIRTDNAPANFTTLSAPIRNYSDVFLATGQATRRSDFELSLASRS